MNAGVWRLHATHEALNMVEKKDDSMPTYRYIENEGVLFRTTGPSNAFPHEIWSPKQKQFLLYQGDVPKPQDWGEEISEAEAQAWMKADLASGV